MPPPPPLLNNRVLSVSPSVQRVATVRQNLPVVYRLQLRLPSLAHRRDERLLFFFNPPGHLIHLGYLYSRTLGLTSDPYTTKSMAFATNYLRLSD